LTEEYEINDSCFSYVGGMQHDEAVRYFNHLMENGIWIDPDSAIEQKNWSDKDKQSMKEKMKKAFDRKSTMYGEIAFGIICADRVTGQFEEERDFRSVD